MSAWTRALKFLATGTFSLLLTSCYGTIQAMYGVPFRLREATIRTQTVAGAPIPGLHVVVHGNHVLESGTTDASGEVVLTADPDVDLEILVTDTDGAANLGDFSDAVQPVPKIGGPLGIDVTMLPR